MSEEERIRKLKDIANIKLGDSKLEVSQTCKLILTIWEIEEDEEIRMAVKNKLEEILVFMAERIPWEQVKDNP